MLHFIINCSKQIIIVLKAMFLEVLINIKAYDKSEYCKNYMV
jgi:hypothetical protein